MGARGTARATTHGPQTETGLGARGTARPATHGPQLEADPGARGTARPATHDPHAKAQARSGRLGAAPERVRQEQAHLHTPTAGMHRPRHPYASPGLRGDAGVGISPHPPPTPVAPPTQPPRVTPGAPPAPYLRPRQGTGEERESGHGADSEGAGRGGARGRWGRGERGVGRG
ncbi:hypothetical protein CG740_20755 [Streptomyces sp. CB01201]|nr:hypothetical protein CG740_20755 [Streptomyces sp. CB01201]